MASKIAPVDTKQGGDDDLVSPFLIGALVGGLLTAAIAIIIGEQRNGVITAVRGASRRGRRHEDHPRFELLLQ